MHLLHTHWQPPQNPTDPGGMLFWTEMTEGPALPWQRGYLSKNPKPKPHPFCAPQQILETALGWKGDARTTTLRLPTTRSGPRPSPGLLHPWELDEDTPPFLAPWLVSGLWLPPADAWHLLLELPALGANKKTAHRLSP